MTLTTSEKLALDFFFLASLASAAFLQRAASTLPQYPSLLSGLSWHE
jgi:hypothetical protein